MTKNYDNRPKEQIVAELAALRKINLEQASQINNLLDSKEKNKTVPVQIDKAVRVTSNDGGYLGGECLCCGQGGWLKAHYGYRHDSKEAKERGNVLRHKKDCPMNEHASK